MRRSLLLPSSRGRQPCSNGLGADNFAIIWDGRPLHGLNSSGIAPAAWSQDFYRRKCGDDPANRPVPGGDMVIVPGAIAGHVLLHEKMGRLPSADALAPAIEHGGHGLAVSPPGRPKGESPSAQREGSPVSPVAQDKWRLAQSVLRGFPGCAGHLLSMEFQRRSARACRGLGTRIRRLRRHEVSGLGAGALALIAFGRPGRSPQMRSARRAKRVCPDDEAIVRESETPLTDQAAYRAIARGGSPYADG